MCSQNQLYVTDLQLTRLNWKENCFSAMRDIRQSFSGSPSLFRCVAVTVGVAVSIHPSNRLNWPHPLFTPTVFWLLGWIALSSNSQPKSNVTITFLLSSPEITALSCWCSCVQYSSPKNTCFSASGLFFCVLFRSFFLSLSLSAYQLSAFLSKDIHQRNIAPPSLVTPAALCQLSEPRARTAAAAAATAADAGKMRPSRQCTPAQQYSYSIKHTGHYFLNESRNINSMERVRHLLSIYAEN